MPKVLKLAIPEKVAWRSHSPGIAAAAKPTQEKKIMSEFIVAGVSEDRSMRLNQGWDTITGYGDDAENGNRTCKGRLSTRDLLGTISHRKDLG